ncbi:hypothetical protein ABIA38_001867 [Embleya sp. AB8]
MNPPNPSAPDRGRPTDSKEHPTDPLLDDLTADTFESDQELAVSLAFTHAQCRHNTA